MCGHIPGVLWDASIPGCDVYMCTSQFIWDFGPRGSQSVVTGRKPFKRGVTLKCSSQSGCTEGRRNEVFVLCAAGNFLSISFRRPHDCSGRKSTRLCWFKAAVGFSTSWCASGLRCSKSPISPICLRSTSTHGRVAFWLKNLFAQSQIARLSPVSIQSCIEGHFKRDQIILKMHQRDPVDASIRSVCRKMLVLVDKMQNKSLKVKSHETKECLRQRH